jgi:hypothetical protein
MQLVEGDAVDVNYQNSGKWYPGTIGKVHGEPPAAPEPEGLVYDIKYNDGDSEDLVPADRLRPKGAKKVRVRVRYDHVVHRERGLQLQLALWFAGGWHKC